MTITLTGHAEIDQQHVILDRLVDHFDRFCEEAGRKSEPTCVGCSAQRRQECTGSLARLTGELLAVLVGHVTYEERLMDLLPAIPKCQIHVKGHKDAHADISQRLSRLAARIAEEDPRSVGIQLGQIAGDWLGSHTDQFDASLASHLEVLGSPEITFDGALVAILDQYVFHCRPTSAIPPAFPAPPVEGMQADVQTRFESLTPRQREVCRLVVGGMMNKEIATRLGTTINTVKTHRAEVFRKMEATSLLDLVRATDALRASGHQGAQPEAGKPRLRASAKRPRVVVMADREVLRQTMIASLSGLGYDTCGAKDHSALYEEISATPADVVVMDIGVAGDHDGGIATETRLRQAAPCGIVALTAADDVMGTPGNRRAGADAYLAKPVDYYELSAVMAHLTQHLRSA